MVSISDFNLQDVIMPLSNQFVFILRKIQLLVGGIFGLAFIAFFIRFIQDRKNVRHLISIQHQLTEIKHRLDAIDRTRRHRK